MPVFEYKAYDNAGNTVSGETQSDDIEAAQQKIASQGLLLVSPGIFRSFLAWQGADANSQESLKRLQRSVLKAGWHLVGSNHDGARRYGCLRLGAVGHWVPTTRGHY